MNPDKPTAPSKGSVTIIENGVARTFRAGERIPADLAARANAAIREHRADIRLDPS